MKRILLAGGNSGGHLFPGLSLARELERQQVARPIFLHHQTVMEKKLLDSSGIETMEPPWRGIGSIPAAFLRVPRARRWLQEHSFDAVVSLGARPAVAMGLAARSLRIPLFLLEQNRAMGLANRLLMRLSRKVFLSWPLDRPSRSLRSRTALLGCPVRDQFVPQELPLGTKPLILILGGSQGSEEVNDSIVEAIRYMNQRDQLRVLHACGEGKSASLLQRWRDAGVEAEVVPFIDDMATAIAEASLVVSRSGGSTVAELCCTGRPAMYFPFRHHGDQHQLLNASFVASHGAAVVVDDHSPEHLGEVLDGLLADRNRLVEMALAARNLGRYRCAERIAEIIATHLGVDRPIEGTDGRDHELESQEVLG